MKISLIVAVGKNLSIGLKGKIPWKLPADLKKFKELTLGHHIIMGRKTFESIGKPLPLRDSIVVTKNENYSCPDKDVYIVHSLEKGVDLARRRGETEVFICGGHEIYKEAIPITDTLYLTEVDYNGPADAFFPAQSLNLKKDWKIFSDEYFLKDEKNNVSFCFKIFHRK